MLKSQMNIHILMAMTFKFAKVFVFVITQSLCLTGFAYESTVLQRDIDVSIDKFYEPDVPENPTTKRLLRLVKETPGLGLSKWGGITLPDDNSKASLMMAIAGDTAPDIGEAWFHVIGAEVRNGFLHPLNEWIGNDDDGNGIIDDDETLWEPWKKVHPLWRKVAMKDGKVYGIPQVGKSEMGIIFRTDLVRAAGLNPNNPPETWDEFMDWCHKLTIPHKVFTVRKEQKGSVP